MCGRSQLFGFGALCILLFAGTLRAEKVTGLKQPVEIIRDKWGIPHIYARNQDDLFFAQGWITAKDRLFQIDLWRRHNTGKLAEILGPRAIARDRMSRLMRFRGDWNAEWTSYAPDTRAIAVAFTNGINAYIQSLNGRRTLEFRAAGYDPGRWAPEDVVARIAGLIMSRNVTSEVNRAIEVSRLGAATVERFAPPDPFVRLAIPPGLDLAAINSEIVRDYQSAAATPRIGQEGSNNWVVGGAKTTTGKPILANDPHRPIQLPSLRKTVHLVAPGWNAIGAGEPALPGIALGHNEHIAFGFTIAGIDQQDLYVEKLNPANHNEYRFRGAWRAMEMVKEQIGVKGGGLETVELRFTVHGPVIHTDAPKNLAYSLRWAGFEPGGAGYLAALSVARARNWKEFTAAMARYKVPSENMAYADTQGNIGWIAGGLTPIRKNWPGLLPVPGDTGEYEWSGFLPISEMPQSYNPPKQFIATANHNILPPGYRHVLQFEWAAPYRFQRIEEILSDPRKKFSVADFERLQHDVVSIPARRLQAVVRRARPSGHRELVDEFLRWDARITADSRAALLYEVWIAALPQYVLPREWRGRGNFEVVLSEIEKRATPALLGDALDLAVREMARRIPDRSNWTWGTIHRLQLRHPLNRPEWNLEVVSRPGDAHTVNAAGGTASGASYRQIIDLADWDRSVMTNVPGESGDPESKHFKNLLADWAAGRYHPMLFSRKAVESAADERIVIEPR